MDKGEMYIQSNFGKDPIGHCPVNRYDSFT